MIKAIQKFFDDYRQENSNKAVDSSSVRLATAALLFEVARADFDLDSDELELINNLIASQFSLDEEEVNELLLMASKEAEESLDLHAFTSLVNQHWTIEERTHLVEHMWSVVYSDGRLDDHEQHIMRKLQALLHVPHRDYITAKIRQMDAKLNKHR
ncbi:MAG: hypothetical protein CL398_09800 [Acidiferrobacteraceae bacterium]|nr:hypothetical protein [Acidiferrobacteraceae bacterium]